MLLGAVLFFIFIVQLIAIRCWRRRINRLYYEEQRELKEAEEAARMEAAIRDFDASLVRLVIRREADTLDADADKEEPLRTHTPEELKLRTAARQAGGGALVNKLTFR